MEKEHREDVLFHFEVLGPYKYTWFSNTSSNASLLVFLVLAIFIFLPYSAFFSSLLSSDAKYFILFASSPKAFNITFWFAVTA